MPRIPRKQGNRPILRQLAIPLRPTCIAPTSGPTAAAFVPNRPNSTGKMKVEAASTRKSLLGEGPHWDERNSTLLMVDALGREVVRYDPSCGTESQVIRTEGDLGNVIPFADDNRQVALCMEQGLYRLNLDTHQKELLVEMLDPESPVKSRLNDGKCDALGRLWTGSMPSTGVQNVIPGKNNFWCYSKGKLQHKLDGVTLSNGITWTTDNRVMFYDDSVPGQIYAFDFDLTAGEISNRRLLADFSTTPGYEGLGVPDGMTIDLNNKIWVACFGGSAVVQIDPETAKILTKISFPAKYTTSCCFGGKNYDVLYVTTGSFRPDATRPEDGLLYRVTELGAKGKAAYEFAG
ncbi:regucalcin isoform X2 [Dermacentor silvarum]|nr:regucalcin isoform X2 [Dermacentor silvarum]